MISQLNLTQSTAVDGVTVADELVKTKADCVFIYVNIGDQHASTIENVRRAQRAFFAQSVDDPDVVAGLPLCGASQWPEIAKFRQAILDYSTKALLNTIKVDGLSFN